MTEDTYKILSVIGSWLAGIGALAAVITSLWLARKSGKIDLIATVKHVKMVTPGIEETPDYVNIKVVNSGLRPVRITCIGWQVGSFKNKAHYVQTEFDKISDQIPKQLYEGEEANFMIPFYSKNHKFDWIGQFTKDVIKPNKEKNLKTLKAIIYTSVNQNFCAKIDDNLIKTLREKAEANK